jgi:hypothetical protein
VTTLKNYCHENSPLLKINLPGEQAFITLNGDYTKMKQKMTPLVIKHLQNIRID